MAPVSVDHDDVLSPTFVIHIVRRRWRLLAAAVAAGALLGLASSFVLSPGYAATTKVLLQNVADEEELLTEAQIATSQVVLDRAADRVGWTTGARLRDAVSARVTDGNVIEIRAVAPTTERAVELVDAATQEFVSYSDRLVADTAGAADAVLQDRRAALVDRIETLTDQLAEAQRAPQAGEPSPQGATQRAEIDRIGRALDDANAELDGLDGTSVENEADSQAARTAIRVLEPAVLRGAAPPTPLQLAAGGGVAAGLVCLAVLLTVVRADRRIQEPTEVARALGGVLIGTAAVAVPEAAAGPAESRTWRRRVAGWVADDRVGPRAVDLDDAVESKRFERVVTRIGRAAGTPLRLLTLVASDDPAALRGVAALAVAAGARAPSRLVTDDPVLAALVGESSDRVLVRPRSVPLPPAAGPELVVAVVDPARPMVPELRRAAGVLVVATTGSRTGWELVALSAACTDAAHALLGVLVVSPVPVGAAPDLPDHHAGEVPELAASTPAGERS